MKKEEYKGRGMKRRGKGGGKAEVRKVEYRKEGKRRGGRSEERRA